jgi:hypothetical protein
MSTLAEKKLKKMGPPFKIDRPPSKNPPIYATDYFT